ncbi:CBO0543 family protein [Lysinibacillus capsici]|uniref:CBO0543 family protein n=1 Tax=Lysinibacillus capsici TaxID=2115968 RepID=UPI0027E3CA59|nr:CBO0543 family protein [Lysinibacillus capsici]
MKKMILHLLLAFLIPWIICILHLYKRDKMLLFLFAPYFSVSAYIINAIGFYYDFWEVLPFPNQKHIATLPFDLGIYPVLGCYLIYFIKKFNRAYLIIFLMSLFTTFLEMIFFYFGRVIYENGWNVYLTFFSYLFPYLFLYWYYKFLIKINIKI